MNNSTQFAQGRALDVICLGRLAVDLVTGFSLIPLQIFSMLGMLLAFASVAFLNCCYFFGFVSWDL